MQIKAPIMGLFEGEYSNSTWLRISKNKVKMKTNKLLNNRLAVNACDRVENTQGSKSEEWGIYEYRNL